MYSFEKNDVNPNSHGVKSCHKILRRYIGPHLNILVPDDIFLPNLVHRVIQKLIEKGTTAAAAELLLQLQNFVQK